MAMYARSLTMLLSLMAVMPLGSAGATESAILPDTLIIIQKEAFSDSSVALAAREPIEKISMPDPLLPLKHVLANAGGNALSLERTVDDMPMHRLAPSVITSDDKVNDAANALETVHPGQWPSSSDASDKTTESTVNSSASALAPVEVQSSLPGPAAEEKPMPETATAPSWGPARIYAPSSDGESIHQTVQDLGRDSTKPIYGEIVGAWTVTGFVVDGSSRVQCAIERKTQNGSSFAYLIEARKNEHDFRSVLLVPSPAANGTKTIVNVRVDNLSNKDFQGTVRDGALEIRSETKDLSFVHDIMRKGSKLQLSSANQGFSVAVDLHGSADAMVSLTRCTDLGLQMIKD